MTHSSESLLKKDFAEDGFLYAQLNLLSLSGKDKPGCCRIAMKKFQQLCSSLHIPVSSFNRAHAQKQFLKSVLGTLLHSELQLSSSQSYQGEVISVKMFYPDKLPMLEITILDVQSKDDPGALIPLNSYRFNLNDKWEIADVSISQQAFSDNDMDIIDTHDIHNTPKLRKVAADLLTADIYAGPDFDENYIDIILDDIQFIKLDDHINAAFQYFNLDRNQLRQTLIAVDSDLKKLRERAKDPNLPKELSDEISQLDVLLTSQQRLCRNFEKDLGNAQEGFQEECIDNKTLIGPLHDILNNMQEALNKQISSDISRTKLDEDIAITNSHDLLGYVSIASNELEEVLSESIKSYQKLKDSLAKKIVRLRTEYPGNFDKISENRIEATITELKSRILKQVDSINKNNHLREVAALEETLHDMEESNKATLQEQQKSLSWIPEIKINLNHIEEQNYLSELKNASDGLNHFFQFYSHMSSLLTQSRSYVSDNTIHLILSTCNLVLHNPNVSFTIKNQLIENLNQKLFKGCIVKDKKTTDYIFLSDKRREEIEASYRVNMPNLADVLQGLEQTQSTIVSLTAQLDFALNHAPVHPEDAVLLALANDFSQSSPICNLVKQYNADRQQLRAASRNIASRIATIKNSPELRARMLPTLLVLEQNLAEITIRQSQDQFDQHIADLTSYKILEESYRSDAEKISAVGNQLDIKIISIQQALLKIQSMPANKQLDFEYAFSKLSQISQLPRMSDKVAMINDVIQHDYELFSDNTISFRLREWLRQLQQRHPISGLLLDPLSKNLIYQPEKKLAIATENINRVQEITAKIAHELKANADSQQLLATRWETKQESIDHAIAKASNDLKKITETREFFAGSIAEISKQNSQFERNFIRDLALYQETITEVESNNANQKIFSDVKKVETLIQDMQALQQSFDSKMTPLLLQQTDDKIRMLQEEAKTIFTNGAKYQADLFKPDVLKAQNEKVAQRNWLFLLIKMLVIDGLPNYWQGKGSDSIKLGGQAYQVPIPIKEIAEKIVQLENMKFAKSLPITEQDIRWLLTVDFKQGTPLVSQKEIYDLLTRIRTADLQDIKQLEALNSALSSTVEVALQIPASQTSLNQLFHIIQYLILQERPFWDTQHGKNKFQLIDKHYENLPHRVMQMAESLSSISGQTSAVEKITVLLGKDKGKKGFFSEKPSYDLLNRRTSSTNALYRAMAILHKVDLSKEANVKMLISEFNSVQNTVNETKKSIKQNHSSSSSIKLNKSNDS